MYVDTSELVEKFEPENPVDFLDDVAEKKLVPVLNAGYDKMYDHMNAYTKRMVMAREVIADRGVWTAKKRYILHVLDNEGVRYSEPKIKIMGLEAVKSSTPQVVRGKFKDAFKIILTGKESDLQKFVADFEKDFKSMEPEDVSFPRGVSEISKWEDSITLYKKGCPIHVRGSIVYNDMIKKKNLDKSNELIKNGSKVKFCYLSVPNPSMGNVVSFDGYLPKELDLHQYVDYQTQFDKTFKAPLEIITKSIGWNVTKVATLESFFG